MVATAQCGIIAVNLSKFSFYKRYQICTYQKETPVKFEAYLVWLQRRRRKVKDIKYYLKRKRKKDLRHLRIEAYLVWLQRRSAMWHNSD